MEVFYSDIIINNIEVNFLLRWYKMKKTNSKEKYKENLSSHENIILTKRQIDLLNLFVKNENKVISREKLSSLFNVGQRTIYNEVKSLNHYLISYNSYIVKSTNKTYIFKAHKKEFLDIRQDLKRKQKQLLFDSSTFRVQYILYTLLNSTDFIKSTYFEKKMFISETMMSKDLKTVRKKIKKYHLELKAKPYYGLKILGKESNKRRIIVDENIIKSPLNTGESGVIKVSYISDALANLLLDFHVKVSDLIFQNLITHVYSSIIRVNNGYFLEETNPLDALYSHSYEISKRLFINLGNHYHFEPPEEEIKNLAINLQAKREYDKLDYINSEINKVVSKNLKSIHEKYHIDFFEDVNLRISLALHTKALITRLKTNRQLNNTMTYDIKQKSGYAFDIASEYGYQLYLKYGFKVTDDEVAYLSLYFIKGLQSELENKVNRKILIVSSQRQSNNALIQMQIQQWFNQSLITEFISMYEYKTSMQDKYSVILTTEEDFLLKCNKAVLINSFPTEKDRLKIELALNGIKNTNEILDFFDSRLFFYGEVTNKQDMLKKLCEKVEHVHPTNNELLNSVLAHEKKVESYFGNQFAMPHPDTPLTKKSYICVGIPKKPLKWNNNEGVKIVFLICIGKKDSNKQALQTWQYLSYLIKDQAEIYKILKKPTYENFIQSLFDFYQNILSE